MKRFIAFIIIVAAGFFIQSGYINEYPTHIHAWAEQDHYALALGFIDNHFDFLHPQTFIYNKQFPGWWKEAYSTTITSAGFPVHEYSVALLMKLFGTTSPWVFRVWSLLWGIIGLFFLFKISLHLTQDYAKSFLTPLIAMTSPVFAYYMNGFLPGIPAFSWSAIGLWCYLNYLGIGSKKHFHLSIAAFTLAMLIRTTFAIGLIAMLCFELLRIFRKESTFLDKLPSVLIALTAFSASFLWNRHLRLTYGTIFLSQLLPSKSWQDAKEILNYAYNYWGTQYFQGFHYWVIIIIFITALCFGIYGMFRRKSFKKTSGKKTLSLWWLPAIQLFGCLLFTIAMMQQVRYHDYYFIDTFFLPILFIVTLTLMAIPKPNKKYLVGTEYFIMVSLCTVMILNAIKTQESRRNTDSPALSAYNNFNDADLLLDSLDVSHNAKILCLYGFAQNGPFIQMGRKGYIVMKDNDELLEAAFTWDFDYAVMENEKFNAYSDKRSNYFSQLKKIGGNDKISVFLRL